MNGAAIRNRKFRIHRPISQVESRCANSDVTARISSRLVPLRRSDTLNQKRFRARCLALYSARNIPSTRAALACLIASEDGNGKGAETVLVASCETPLICRYATPVSSSTSVFV